MAPPQVRAQWKYNISPALAMAIVFFIPQPFRVSSPPQSAAQESKQIVFLYID
jgi:hypothetical protein